MDNELLHYSCTQIYVIGYELDIHRYTDIYTDMSWSLIIASMCGMHTQKVNTNQFKRWIDL